MASNLITMGSKKDMLFNGVVFGVVQSTIQVTSVDGGWGPLSLRKVQQAGLGVSKTSFLILHHPFLFFQFVR